MNIEAFAKMVEKEQILRYLEKWKDYDRNKASHNEALVRYCKTTVRKGHKYTKVDVGESGRFMIDKKTGAIYGVKAYGIIDKNASYGTLSTTKQWEWGNYRPVERIVVNTYTAIYRDRNFTVKAKTACDARHKAMQHFELKVGGKILIFLNEIDGKPVLYTFIADNTTTEGCLNQWTK